MKPLISIGMPVYNCEKTLEASVYSLLNQTFQSWELLLLDDGSTDSTLSLINSFKDDRIRIFSDGVNRGLPERLNQAVALSRGRYFARMDGDDIAYPERLEIQFDYLERHPRTDLLSARVLIFDSAGDVVGTYPFREDHEAVCSHPQGGFYFPHPTWMGRIEWFRRHPYDTDQRRSQDQTLLLSAHLQSRLHSLPLFLLGYRQEALSLKQILSGRAYYARALWRSAIQNRRYQWLTGIAEHFLKGCFDLIAVKTKLNYRLLKHRALSVPPDEIHRWRQIWHEIEDKKRLR